MKYRVAFLMVLCSGRLVQGQTTPTPGTGGSPSTGATPSGGRTVSPVAPSPPTTGSKSPTSIQRPTFISGKVVTDDGSPVPPNITIQRVCNGSPHSVAFTDMKGHFSFQWGQTNGMVADASEAGPGNRNNTSIGSGYGGAQAAGGIGNGNDPFGSNITNCELRANVAGFRSSSVSLFSHTSMDVPEIGSIVLHRLANVEGTSVSATAFLAPKDAKKAYERGLQSLLKNKNEEAAKDFEKAVDAYPKYADAWMNLGKVRLTQREYEPARNALMKALEADAKLVGPYVELGLLAGAEQKWEDSSRFLDRAVRLDPIDFPEAWYADAVANYNLKKYDIAEKSAREAVKLDPKHLNPRADYLLGLVLIERHDYAGAANELKTYLQLSPTGADLQAVRNKVTELENAMQK